MKWFLRDNTLKMIRSKWLYFTNMQCTTTIYESSSHKNAFFFFYITTYCNGFREVCFLERTQTNTPVAEKTQIQMSLVFASVYEWIYTATNSNIYISKNKNNKKLMIQFIWRQNFKVLITTQSIKTTKCETDNNEFTEAKMHPMSPNSWSQYSAPQFNQATAPTVKFVLPVKCTWEQDSQFFFMPALQPLSFALFHPIFFSFFNNRGVFFHGNFTFAAIERL